MTDKEILNKMLILASEHIYSLEVYEEFPNVPVEKVDKAKRIIQEILKKLAESK